MKKIRAWFMMLAVVVMALSITMTAYADSVDDAGGTGQGNISGTNVYTFSYIYDGTIDAIVLKVDTKNPVKAFGNTCSHTFGPGDTTTLNTNYPQLGSSLESAIATMNAYGGYNLSASDAKATLQAMGYYDKGNGVWKYDGGYLTYVSAAKIRPQNHTVSYDANGGTGAPSAQTKYQGQTLTLSSTKPSKTGYTFVNWTASIGGNYNAGGSYTHDQSGGTVTMKANWTDSTAPSGSITATPNSWSCGNGTVSLTVQDLGSGISSVKLQRYSYVTGTWSDIGSWSYSGTTSSVSKSHTETSEGVFYYKLTVKDVAGNTTEKTTAAIYLDHSNPVISGASNTVTTWTNTAPTISVSATDYLSGTSYGGSGVKSIVIKNESGTTVASGTTSASYTLKSADEGVRTWTIVSTDNVGHTSSTTVTTRYDITAPSCSELTATPNTWSSGSGTVVFSLKDGGVGSTSAVLERYSYVTKTWSTVKTCTYTATTNDISESYTETTEGVFLYRLTLKDKLGNTRTKTSSVIYLDHSSPVISGMENTVTTWTNVAPSISVSATDYLVGTTYTGSGLKSIVIYDDANNVVASGVSSTSYTLADKYEGIHTWKVIATDNVGRTSSKTVTTKFDKTKPYIEGTEVDYVTPDGVTVHGYCQDNIISQHIDDWCSRSDHTPNVTSGIKSVILYKYTSAGKTVIYGDTTKKTFSASDTNSYFDMYYEMPVGEKNVKYYLIVVEDFAGNVTKKKLVSQQSMLTWFHTSIDRGSYE